MKGGFFDKYAGSIPSIYVLSSSCYMNLISNVMMDIYSMQRQAYFSVHEFLKVLVVQIRRSISTRSYAPGKMFILLNKVTGALSSAEQTMRFMI